MMLILASFVLTIIIIIKIFLYPSISWLDFITFKGMFSKDFSGSSENSSLEDTNKGDTPSISGAKCEFEGEDIFNGHVFSKQGSPIKNATKIDCDNCNEYVNKKQSKCVNYIYDKTENESSGDKSDWPGSKKTPDADPNEGMCTSSLAPTGNKCSF